MKEQIEEIFRQALAGAAGAGELAAPAYIDIVVEKPKDEKLGDFSSNLALVLSRAAQKNPRDLAGMLAEHIPVGEGGVESVSVAGPGFINLKMSRGFYRERLKQVVAEGERHGYAPALKNQKVLLEFVSANPTGPLHVGHGRGAAVGDCLGRLLKVAGYDVRTEYYINDVGNQMNILGRSTWLRYRELLGRPSGEFPEDHYQGDYIMDIAREIEKGHGGDFLDRSEEEVLPFFRKTAANWVLGGIKKDLGDFRVHFDNWFSEQTLYDDGSVDRALNWLRERGFVYDKDGAVWLKSSAFQDDKDRVVVKQSGEQTYFCSDIAYHQNKIERGFTRLIDLFGADHHGYVPRMKAVMEALGYDRSVFHAILVQFVTLKRGGEKVQMSTRSGQFITLSEVVAEVGVDVARYFFLMRGSDTHLDFDLELAKAETPENPVYYIQYAHARICNIFITARQQSVAWPPAGEVDLSPLAEDEEFTLIKKILAFPEVVEKSAQALEVHRVPHYLHELVAVFHGYYKRYRVVTEDGPRTLARLFLLEALRITIQNGLAIMGISAPEKM
jgi:arginyl-tRNA synthetase